MYRSDRKHPGHLQLVPGQPEPHLRPACGWEGKREKEADIHRRAKRTEHATGEEDGEEDLRELGEESVDSESIGKGDGVPFHLLDPWHRL